MAYMTWKADMSVGLEELDQDHRFLIQVINRLAVNAEDDGDAEAIRECLASLRNYAEFHFAREESVMRACGYSTLAEHQDEHRAFTREIAAIVDRFDQGDANVRAEINENLIGYLKDWLTHHILVVDMGYRPLVEGNDKARAAAQGFKGSQAWYGT
jgi:hemerythrin-like metal-binding protein